MTYEEIRCYNLINEVDEEKVNKIADSIRKNGFIGCPILVWGDVLLTGSHRLAALNKMAEEDEEFDEDIEVAEDITDVIEENIKKYEEENGYIPDIDFGNIGWLLKDSWVEEYKDEIIEW